MRADEIPGWFAPVDENLFRWFLNNNGAGDLAEIGPYLGRSAVVVGEYVRPAETFTVIDLFGDAAPDAANSAETVREYPTLTRGAFEGNYRAMLGTLPTIVQAPSSALPDHARHGTHRFVHVDGSHLYEHVVQDIASARLLLSEDGIVALDDITSAHTPGVWAAAWEAVITGGLMPVAVTEHKMYATWGDWKGWQKRLMATPPLSVACETQTVLRRPLLRCWVSGSSPPTSFASKVARRLRNL